jgi:hypothetical protein
MATKIRKPKQCPLRIFPQISVVKSPFFSGVMDDFFGGVGGCPVNPLIG